MLRLESHCAKAEPLFRVWVRWSNVAGVEEEKYFAEYERLTSARGTDEEAQLAKEKYQYV
jgi:hypothetical protein